MQIIAWCLRSSRHFQCWGRRARHCSSRNVPPPSPKSDRPSGQPRARFVPPNDASNPARWPVQERIPWGSPPVSWRRTAFDDAPGSQSDCAPSRAHSAKGTLRRLSRELPRGNETTAYYTDNLEDAVNTAVEMARKRTLETPPYGAKRRVLPDRA
jgi:hypothetical protein